MDPRGLQKQFGSFSDGSNDYTYDYTPNPNVSLTSRNQEVPGSSNNSLSLTSNNVEAPGLANAPEWIDKGRGVSNSSGLANKIIKEAVSFIPVVGSGIESYNNFKDGNYVRGSIYAGLAVAEAVPGLVALSKGAKFAPKIVSSVAKFLKGTKSGPLHFSQESVGRAFQSSKTSPFKYAGESVADVAKGLRSGNIRPNEIPVRYIVENGKKIAVDNRSLLSLRRAGLNPTKTIDVTNNATLRSQTLNRVKEQLGGVPSTTIRVGGAGKNASVIY